MFTTFKPIYDFKFEMILFRLVHYYNTKKDFSKRNLALMKFLFFDKEWNNVVPIIETNNTKKEQ